MKINMTKLILIYGLLILINACVTRGASHGDINGKWKLTGYNFSPMQEFPIEKMTIDLTITDNKQIGGRSACNLYAGTVDIGSGNKIKIGPLTWTERSCPETEAEFESRFLDTLQNSSQFSLEKGILTIINPKTSAFLRFQRAAEPVKEIPTKEDRQTFFVHKQMARCSPKSSSKCLQIKSDRNSIWHVLTDPITGFDFKPGRFYKIEVLREKAPNEPNKPSFYRYKLDRIIKSARSEKDLYK